MNIRDIRALKQTASQRLQTVPQASRIILIYGGITIALSALVTVVNYCLGLEISQTGGLSNIGIRSLLSTIQTVLPMAQSLLLMCLELGYVNAMLRISREQYATPNSLRMGIDRFWPLLRASLLQSAIYFGILFLSIYLAIQIFLITPLSNDAMALASEMMGAGDPMTMIDETMYLAFYDAMLPLFPIFGVVCLVLVVPVFYQYRLVNYILIDNPGYSTMMVLRESRKLMKRNRFHLFRLDLSMWWYFLLSALASVAGYGDMLLSMVGITLPMPETVSYFLFYGIYLVLELAIFYLFLNHVSVTYALAYQSLCPEKKEENAVVLGNIFQM